MMTWPLRRFLVMAVVLLVALLIPSGTASAHTQLLSSTPQAGQHLIASPSMVSVTFDQILLPTGGAMVVTDSQHHFVNVGRVKLDGATISVAVKPNLPGGTYQAAYRVISADGHPIESAFTFTVGKTADTTVPTPASVAGGPTSPPTASLLPFLWLALAVILVSVALLLVRRRSSQTRRTHDAPS